MGQEMAQFHLSYMLMMIFGHFGNECLFVYFVGPINNCQIHGKYVKY
jgi:hypothetical protein